MKDLFIKICWPILRFFEPGQFPEAYKVSHRVTLIVMGALFFLLSSASIAATYFTGLLGALIPSVVFFAVGLVTLVVGILGSQGAVAKIWGAKG